MRKIGFILPVLILITVCSCTKKTKGQMTVIKNCEGYYLRYNALDYSICNERKLSAFSNGESVTATFVNDQNGEHDLIYVCMVVHGFPTAEGSFRIVNIK